MFVIIIPFEIASAVAIRFVIKFSHPVCFYTVACLPNLLEVFLLLE